MGLRDFLFGKKNNVSDASLDEVMHSRPGTQSDRNNMNYDYTPPKASPRTVTVYDPPGQHMRIIIDSLKLMEKTTNPDTYFSRYKLASNEACGISDIPDEIYNGMNARQIYDWLNERSSKNKLQQQFVDRLFEHKKENSIAYQMFEVGFEMTPETREYYLKKLDGKKFRFCRVKFDVDSNKSYTYITKDKKISVGDTVSVVTGNGFVNDEKLVQVTEVFDDSLDNLPFELTKLRCVERKLRGIECPHCGASIQVDVGQKTGKCGHCGAEFYLLQ